LEAAPVRTDSDLQSLSAVAAITAMRNGEIKAEDYAQSLLGRAQALAALNAFRVLDREMVLEAARGADKYRAKGRPLGALHGLPIPVKDSVNTKALPTSNGTRALERFMAPEDAEVLQRLFAQGAILMGKTNLHELSYGWTSNNEIFGPVRNPYSLAHIPGGSSGGSGAAVAARMAPLAVAEDTLGSIRVPASMCGLAGLRPSYGRYPDEGILPISDNKFDQVGPVARSVADLVLFDSAITGDVSPVDATSLKGMRIGVSPEYFLSGLDPDMERVTSEALRRLSAAGATLVWAEIPDVARSMMAVVITINVYETQSAMASFLKAYQAGITFEEMVHEAGEGTRGVLNAFALPPNKPSRELYESMLRQRQEIKAAIGGYFAAQQITALAFPPVMIAPPKIGEDIEVTIRGEKVPLYVTMARNTALGSCASMASLILPAGMSAQGLPIGMEFSAPSGNDRELLALGLSLEKALGPIPAPNI
jgi:mandelamide amidase